MPASIPPMEPLPHCPFRGWVHERLDSIELGSERYWELIESLEVPETLSFEGVPLNQTPPAPIEDCSRYL